MNEIKYIIISNNWFGINSNMKIKYFKWKLVLEINRYINIRWNGMNGNIKWNGLNINIR